MKKLILSALTFGSLSAMARPSTWEMTCSEAAGLVQQEGAVVMNYDYKPGPGYLYSRFVSNATYCGPHERTVAAFVRTADTADCFVGYLCQPGTKP